MKSILSVIGSAVLLCSSPAHAELGGFVGASPFTSSFINRAGYSLEAGVDYMTGAEKGDFRIELITAGLSLPYDASNADYVLSSAVQARVASGIFAGLRAGAQFTDGFTNGLPKEHAFGAVAMTAIFQAGVLVSIDIGASGAGTQFSQVLFGYHF